MVNTMIKSQSKKTDHLPGTSRLKILFLSHNFYPDIGGIESISETLAMAFTNAGHDIHVVTLTGDEGKKKFKFTVIRQPGIKKLLYEHAWADIVFENNPCLQLAWPGVFFKKKSIIAIQTWISRMNGTIGWQDRLKFIFLKRADCVIACSSAIRDKYAPSCFVIGNPYDENIFKKLPNITKSHDFVFVGRLVSDKGADIIIQAFGQLLNRQKQDAVRENLSLTIIGDGPDRNYLERITAELGLEKNIVFTGAKRGEDLVACLNKHRFIIVPSRWQEPFGIVVLEGMACGCLPIVSNCGGLPEAVGAAGLLFKPGDADALVSCINQILNNPNEEKRLRHAAALHLNSYSSSGVSKQYLSLFEKQL